MLLSAASRLHKCSQHCLRVTCRRLVVSSLRPAEGKWTSEQLRQTFMDFFLRHDHSHVRSSPVLPRNDPTLSFVNAGMNQFKPVFLGLSPRPCARAANSQKCVRVGGKHNDLDVVGKDGHHHTFFEMLGNWSFGDYFKKEACEYAWELLTRVYGISPRRLYVTYFGGDESLGLGPDLETRDTWIKMGVPPERVLPFGAGDNFWEMGASGPCGPCTEIHYDHLGRDLASHRVNRGGEDLVEIWNLVFMQYQRLEDGSLQALAVHHVDTGMGLERLSAVCQGHVSNYDTDLFSPIFAAIQKVVKCEAYRGKFGDEDESGLDTAYRIVADHLRMITVAVADGVIPEQNHRLRRVIRQALQVGETHLKASASQLAEVTSVIGDQYGSVYPEVAFGLPVVQETIRVEAEKRSDAKGTRVPEAILRELSSLPDGVIPGSVAFHLYETYGLREDDLASLSESEGLSVDWEDFSACLKRQRKSSKTAADAAAMQGTRLQRDVAALLREMNVPHTDDSFKYDAGDMTLSGATILAIVDGSSALQGASSVNSATVGVILDRTNFYGEAGGQVADWGEMRGAGHGDVMEVQQVDIVDGRVVHWGRVTRGTLQVGQQVHLSVDAARRFACMCNHTAVHLLGSALHRVLPHAQHRSSYVAPDHLRLDVCRLGQSLVGAEEVEQVERQMRHWIHESDLHVTRTLRPLHQVVATSGVSLLPGEVYPEEVVLVEITCSGETSAEEEDRVSAEPCCGTHLSRVRDMLDFAVLGVKSAGIGAKSLRAVTGEMAVKARRDGARLTEEATRLANQVQEALAAQQVDVQKCRELESKLKSLQQTHQAEDGVPFLEKSRLSAVCTPLLESLTSVTAGDSLACVQEEMRTSCLHQSTSPFVLHFSRVDSPKLPLHKVTHQCREKPVLVAARFKGLVHARCCVPEVCVRDDFDAEKWMRVLLDALQATGASPKGQDPRLVYNMKTRKVLDEGSLLRALEKTGDFARSMLAKPPFQ